MTPAHARAFAAAFLLAGAASPQAQTQQETQQAETDCENEFNDSPASDSCTFTDVDAFRSAVIVNGVADPTATYWTCRLTANCTLKKDDGTSVTGSVIRSIPLEDVDDATLQADENGVPMLSWPGDPGNAD